MTAMATHRASDLRRAAREIAAAARELGLAPKAAPQPRPAERPAEALPGPTPARPTAEPEEPGGPDALPRAA